MRLEASAERFPLREPFRIANHVWDAAEVCTVTLSRGGVRGRGEGAPVVYHGETAAQLVGEIESIRPEVERGIDRSALDALMPPGPARCALDCALWDLESRETGRPVHALAGLPAPGPLETAVTITLDTPERMAAQAGRRADHPLLKVKLGGDRDEAAIRAVRAAAPDVRLTVDANTGWTLDRLQEVEPVLVECGVELVEQPLPPEADAALAGFTPHIPIAADESCQTVDDLPRLVGRYQVAVIKLDKTGGLTGALALLHAAEAAGLEAMVSCMIGTSLGMAPARLVGSRCRVVDLDLPLYLARDRDPAIPYERGRMGATPPDLWGAPGA